jgi:hypothetical protein
MCWSCQGSPAGVPTLHLHRLTDLFLRFFVSSSDRGVNAVQWSLLIGSVGQAFAMFYIGVNSAVHPTKAGDPLTGNSIFAIVCVYLFVVFYSFGE